MSKESVTHSELIKLVEYKSDGTFVWKTRTGVGKTRFNGKRAGTFRPDGRYKITINQVHYLSHRLVWFYHNKFWPPNGIDHINHDPTDNRIENLRLADQGQNLQNARKRKTSTSSKWKGVSWDKVKRKWSVYVNGNRLPRKFVGYFSDELEAAIAYNKEAKARFGAYACLNKVGVRK